MESGRSPTGRAEPRVGSVTVLYCRRSLTSEEGGWQYMQDSNT